MQEGIRPKSIKKNYVLTLVYEMFSLLASLVTVPHISRVFGADGVGVYSFTETIAKYFIIFGNLGIATYGQMCIAECRDDVRRLSHVFAELWSLRMISMLVSLGAYLLIALNSRMYRTEMLLQSIMVVAAAFDLTWLFRGVEDFSQIVYRNLLVKAMILVLIFLLVRSPGDVYLYILLVAMSTLVGNLTFLIPTRRLIQWSEFRNLNLAKHIKPCLVFFIPSIATSVYLMLDKAMLGLMTTGSTQNGYYEQAHKIVQVLSVVATSLNMIMRSRMMYLYSRREMDKMRYYMRRSLSFILMMTIPMAVGIVAVAPNLIPVYLGKGFEPSISIIRMLSLLLVFIGLSNCVNTHYLAPSGRQAKNNYVLILGAVLNAACNAFWIPRYGALGAAYASVLAEGVILIGYLVLARDFLRVGALLKIGWRYLLSAGVMYGAVVYMGGRVSSKVAALCLQIACGAAVYLASVLAMRDSFAIENLAIAKRKLLEFCGRSTT